MRYCGYCGGQLIDVKRFCPHCGKEIEEILPEEGAAPAANPMPAPVEEQGVVAVKEKEPIDYSIYDDVEDAVLPDEKRSTIPLKTRLLAGVLALLVVLLTVSSILALTETADVPLVTPLFEKTGLVDTYQRGEYALLEGRFSDKTILETAVAQDVAKAVAQDMGYVNAGNNLRLIDELETNLFTYYRFEQYHQDIPVHGRQLVLVVNENGETMALSSNIKEIDPDVSSTPSMTLKSMTTSVEKYVKDVLQIADVVAVEADEPSAGNLLWYEDVDTWRLSYLLRVTVETAREPQRLRLWIDAHDGHVIDLLHSIEYASVVCQSDSAKNDPTMMFNGMKTNGKYAMADPDRHIYVFDGEERNVVSYKSQNCMRGASSLVTSTAQDKFDSKYDHGVRLMNQVSTVYDFFEKTYGVKGDGCAIVINDATNGTMGGRVYVDDITSETVPSYEEETIGILSMGMSTQEIDLGVVVHEYMHTVTAEHVNWRSVPFSEETEAGAINEAYGDVFGVLVRAALTQQAPDWECCGRDIDDPQNAGYPVTADSMETEKRLAIVGNESFECMCLPEILTSYRHGYSTVISHAAYQMCTGLEETMMPVLPETLMKLWYHTMLTLPPDCSFSQFRDNMEMMAAALGLSFEEQLTVRMAFEKAGIQPVEETCLVYSKDLTLEAVDVSGYVYSDYTITVEGTKTSVLGVDMSYRKEIRSEDMREHGLDLPVGEFDITVTDDVNENKSFTTHIVVDNTDTTMDTLRIVVTFEGPVFVK